VRKDEEKEIDELAKRTVLNLPTAEQVYKEKQDRVNEIANDLND